MKGKKVFLLSEVTHGSSWLAKVKHRVASFFVHFNPINMSRVFRFHFYFTFANSLELSFFHRPSLVDCLHLYLLVGVSFSTIDFLR